MTPHCPHILLIGLISCMLCIAACEEEKNQPVLSVYNPPPLPEQEPPPPNEVEEELNTFTPPALADICQDGQIRCLGSGSDDIRQCQPVLDPQGTSARRWVRGNCPDGQICQQNACVPFSCTPSETSCDTEGNVGTCAPDGEHLVDIAPCPDAQACRGGFCVDLCDSAERSQSYIGCNYLLTSLPNPVSIQGDNTNPEDGPYGLVVSNPDPILSTTLRVETPSGAISGLFGSVQVRKGEDAQQFVGNNDETVVKSTVKDNQGRVITNLQGTAQDIVVPPGGLATLLLDIPRLNQGTSGVFDASRRLISDRPVIAYQFSPYCCNYTFTNDASLLLPTTTLGKDYTYLGAPEWAESPPGLALIANLDGTQVSIDLPQNTRLSLPSALSNVQRNEDTVTAQLSAGQILYLETAFDEDRTFDLTGAQISANQPMAAFSTHYCTFIPQSKAACDHLEEQLLPTDTWGNRYILSPFERRGDSSEEVTYWRIQAGPEDTTLTLATPLRDLDILPPFSPGQASCRFLQIPGENNQKFNLGAGQDCTIGTRYGTTLTSDLPIQVMGFLAGEQASSRSRNNTEASTGDPSMFGLVPIEQFRDEYTFLTPETYAQDYITILVTRDAAGALTLDGKPIDPQSEALRVEPVFGSVYLLIHIPVRDGVHKIEGTTPFGLMVYAYDRFVSYAYAGGLNLIKRAR